MLVPRTLYRPIGLFLVLAFVLLAAAVANGRITAGVGTAAAAVGPCGAGTAFFGSAPVDTKFSPGDVWQGGTFTSIVVNDGSVNDVMNDRLVVTGDQVGRFPSVAGGSTATITFPEPIMVTGILWFGNDPEAGESGWFVNGIAGPNTGDDGAQCTSQSIVTDTITIVTDDSGGIDFWFQPVVGDEGCTPGYWKNHLDSWSGYTPNQTLESVFDVPDSLGMDNDSLLTALQYPGGSGLQGGARILLRAGVAALLNAASAGVDYSLTTSQVISQVNAALASGSRAIMISQGGLLDAANNGQGGCPLN